MAVGCAPSLIRRAAQECRKLRSERREARRRSNHLYTAQGASSVTSLARNAHTIPPPPSSLGRRKPSRTKTRIPRRRITTGLPPTERSSRGFAATERTAGRPHRVQTTRRRGPLLESQVHLRRPLETAMDVVCAWSADERRSSVDNKVGHNQDLFGREGGI